jgi:hypothetical protein
VDIGVAILSRRYEGIAAIVTRSNEERNQVKTKGVQRVNRRRLVTGNNKDLALLLKILVLWNQIEVGNLFKIKNNS